jgi:cysteinyl-tRNA synthetase
MLGLLGLDPLDPIWLARGADDTAVRSALEALVKTLVVQRDAARAQRDFVRADAIRDQLRSAGVDLEDTSSGSRWTVPAPANPGGAG